MILNGVVALILHFSPTSIALITTEQKFPLWTRFHPILHIKEVLHCLRLDLLLLLLVLLVLLLHFFVVLQHNREFLAKKVSYQKYHFFGLVLHGLFVRPPTVVSMWRYHVVASAIRVLCVHWQSVNTYSTSRDISVLSIQISMKLCTNLDHLSGHDWKSFQGHGVKGQSHAALAMEIFVNSIAPELPNGFEPKLTQILSIVGRWTGYVFKVMRSKVKVRSGQPWKSRLLSHWMHLKKNLQKYLMHLGDELKFMGQSQGEAVTIWVRHSSGPPFWGSAIPGYYCYNNPNPNSNSNPRIPGMADLRNGGPLPQWHPWKSCGL